jgi:hypothetical protein
VTKAATGSAAKSFKQTPQGEEAMFSHGLGGGILHHGC